MEPRSPDSEPIQTLKTALSSFKNSELGDYNTEFTQGPDISESLFPITIESAVEHLLLSDLVVVKNDAYLALCLATRQSFDFR